MPRRLLILDLDETLMHATEAPLEREADFRIDAYHVYKRPFVDAFLAQVAEHFDLAVWSSGTKPYVEEALTYFFPAEQSLAFVWTRERCTARIDHDRRSLLYLKDLKKVKRSKKYRLEQILVVDDRPEVLSTVRQLA